MDPLTIGVLSASVIAGEGAGMQHGRDVEHQEAVDGGAALVGQRAEDGVLDEVRSALADGGREAVGNSARGRV